MGAVTQLKTPAADGIRIELDERPLLPEGQYEAVLTHWETAYGFARSAKVYLHFRIVTPGEAFGAKVWRAYNVARLTGKPRRNGGFLAKRRHHITQDIARIVPIDARKGITGVDGIAGAAVLISLRTVKTDSQQQPMASSLRYSVVARLLGLCTEAPST